MDTPTEGHLLHCFIPFPEKLLWSSKTILQSTVLPGLASKICPLEQGWHGRKFLKSSFFRGGRSERRPAVPSLLLGDRETRGATLLIMCSLGIGKERKHCFIALRKDPNKRKVLCFWVKPLQIYHPTIWKAKLDPVILPSLLTSKLCFEPQLMAGIL